MFRELRRKLLFTVQYVFVLTAGAVVLDGQYAVLSMFLQQKGVEQTHDSHRRYKGHARTAEQELCGPHQRCLFCPLSPRGTTALAACTPCSCLT